MSHSFKNTARRFNTGPPVLFLPGWGFDGGIIRLFKPVPDWIYPVAFLDPDTIEKDLLHLLAAEKISKVRLVGWSMGAMMGLEFAAKHRDLIDSLLLVSLRNHWPAPEIREIRAEFSRQPEAFLQSFYRKCFLGNKDAYKNFSSTLESHYLRALPANMDRLRRGIDFLARFKTPDPPPEFQTRLVHGRQDIIAPVKDMPELPGAAVEIIDNAGHIVFLHQDFSLQGEIQKQAIRQKFSRAADSYDDYAKVQTGVARKLAVKLALPDAEPGIRTILEIGCGTGNFTALLAAKFPAARIVALDFSPEMLVVARRKPLNNNVEFLCAEGEAFLGTAPEKSFDLVAANGSMQWFSDIERALHNISRILTPGGTMSCTLFGPRSLQELGKGLQAVRVLSNNLAARSFPARERLLRALHKNFQDCSIEEELIVREYKSAHDLLLHLKKTGTSGWQQKTQQPLTPSRINQLDEWFQKTYGTCRVTYQIFFLQGRN
jgi:malonyl-ACP O-methyltransferase BioC